MWKRWLIIIVCIALVVGRIIWPNIQVDAITIWLIGIATVLFVLPELRVITPYIKRIKIFDAELELQEKIEKLSAEVQKVQVEVSDAPTLESSSELSSDVQAILQETSKDPRAALLFLSTKIEYAVQDQLRQHQIIKDSRYIPLRRAVEMGVNEGIFPQSILPAFNDFSRIRNEIAHNAAFEVSNSSLLSMISLGTELLKAVSVDYKKLDLNKK